MEKVKLNLSPENRRLFSKRQLENRSNPTPSEVHVMGLLDALGERYIFEKGFFTENRFFMADFYLPKPRRICIELDGAIHDDRMGYDFARDCYIMRTRNIKKILRIKNEEALKMGTSELREFIS